MATIVYYRQAILCKTLRLHQFTLDRDKSLYTVILRDITHRLA